MAYCTNSRESNGKDNGNLGGVVGTSLYVVDNEGMEK